MTFWSRIRSWLRAMARRSRMEREMDAELRFHIEAFAEDFVSSGAAREEGIRRARIEFGGVERAKEACREARGVSPIDSLVQGVCFGLGRLRKSPGFTSVAILTLALGIGANSAIFSLVNSVLLRPLPYRDPSRLVWVSNGMPVQRASLVMESDYFARHRHNHAFEDVAACDPGETFTLTGGGEPEQIQAGQATFNFLDVLGVAPRLGRSFRAEEDRLGVPHVVLLTDSLRRRCFSADTAILGRQIALDGQPYTVVGILGRGFEFPDNPRVAVIVPLALER